MKPKIISMILIILLCLCSCANAPLAPGDTTGEDDGIQYPTADLTALTVTYIVTRAGAIPISFCQNAHSKLSGENYYYNLENIAENDLTLSERQFTVFTDTGKNCGNKTFSDITENKISEAPLHTLVTSANWKMCPNLKKTSFSENIADSSYKQFILESFPDVFKTVDDIHVTDLWEYDIDADGTSESIVVANTDSYTIMVLLSQSLGNMVLASSFENDEGFVAIPFVVDLDGNGKYTLMTVWGNTLKTVTVYKESTLDTEYTVYLPIDA